MEYWNDAKTRKANHESAKAGKHEKGKIGFPSSSFRPFVFSWLGVFSPPIHSILRSLGEDA
jgi:hypothetical protein